MEIISTRVKSIRNFFSSIDLKEISLIWDIRSLSNIEKIPQLVKLMEDFEVVHCVDISKGETPKVENDLLYTRLFGLVKFNVYQYDDEELTKIHRISTGSSFKKALLSFHGLRMYMDASRLRVYNQNGEFPQVTNYLGLDSLREVLNEDSRLPATKSELLEMQGWRIIDINAKRRIHASELLSLLPDGTYTSKNQILSSLAKFELTEEKYSY